MPEEAISQLEDKALAGVGLQEPGGEGLQIAQYGQSNENDEHDDQVLCRGTRKAGGNQTVQDSRQRLVANYAVNRDLQR